MHRIFQIKEIVEEILSHVPSGRLATTARVNRVWFFSSLPRIWMFVGITEALTPLGVNDRHKKCKRFREPPTPAQWNRFIIYSTYVRDIVGCESSVHRLVTAVRSRPDTIPDLFPNLRSLRWHMNRDNSLSDISFLISPRLENICLRLHNFPLSFFPPICKTLVKRVEALRSLQIIPCEPSQDTHTENYNELFNRVLEAFASTLINVQMPEAFHTEETIQRLGKIRNLSDLEIGGCIDSLFDKYSMRRWSYKEHDGEKEGYFCRLKNLSFTGSQEAFCNKFLNKGTFSSLVEINWDKCMELDDPKLFVTTISDVCPLLESLTIGDSKTYKGDDRPPIIPWATIRILLGCQCLTSVSLHCCRVTMTSEDLLELLTSRLDGTPTMWKALQIYTESPLSVSDLLLFAKYCPHLEKLGIHLDVPSVNNTPSPSVPPPDGAHSSPEDRGLNRFTRLNFVNFAYSPLDLDLIPEFASFFIKICDVIPFIDGWDWLDFWCYVCESEEAAGKIPWA